MELVEKADGGMPDFNFCVVLNWEVWGHLAFALVFAFGVLEIGSIRAMMITFVLFWGGECGEQRVKLRLKKY